jgi:hypothetical protein
MRWSFLASIFTRREGQSRSATRQRGVTLESRQGKKLLRLRPHWKRLSNRDPFLSLIGTLDDEASDVSRNKYKYLADAYSQ